MLKTPGKPSENCNVKTNDRFFRALKVESSRSVILRLVLGFHGGLQLVVL